MNGFLHLSKHFFLQISVNVSYNWIDKQLKSSNQQTSVKTHTLCMFSYEQYSYGRGMDFYGLLCPSSKIFGNFQPLWAKGTLEPILCENSNCSFIGSSRTIMFNQINWILGQRLLLSPWSVDIIQTLLKHDQIRIWRKRIFWKIHPC